MQNEHENGFGSNSSGLVLNSPPPIEKDYDNSFPGLDEFDHTKESEPEAREEEVEVEVEPENEEPEEGQYESEVHKKTKKDSLKTRLNQIQREKYQAMHALEQAQQENERLRRDAELYGQVSQQLYDRDVATRLEQARRAQAEAIESGDVQAQVDASTELAAAMNEHKEVERWKAEQKYSDKYRQPEISQATMAAREYSMHDWINSREFLNQESEKFDPDLAKEVQLYASAFDQNLWRAGRQDAIGTPEYLNIIDQHIHALSESGAYRQPKKQPLNMKSGRQSVSPVRTGGGGSYGGSQQQSTVRLGPAEKDLISRLGISEKQYVKSMLLDQRMAKERQTGGR